MDQVVDKISKDISFLGAAKLNMNSVPVIRLKMVAINSSHVASSYTNLSPDIDITQNEWERWSSLTRSKVWDREAQGQGQAEQMHSYSDILVIVPAHQETPVGLRKNLPRANWPPIELLEYTVWHINVGLSIRSFIGRENMLWKSMASGWLPLTHKISCLNLTFSLVSLRTPWFALCVWLIRQRTDTRLMSVWKDSWSLHVMLLDVLT